MAPLQDNGRIRCPDRNAGPRSTITTVDVLAAPGIHARLMAEAFHPLLSREVFELLTASACAGEVDYGFHGLAAYLDRASGAPAGSK